MRSEPVLFQNIKGTYSFIYPDGTFEYLEDLEKDRYNLVESFYSCSLDDFIRYSDSKFFKNFDKPYLIYQDGLECPQMDIIRYDSETIKFLNKNGINIFLTELLLKYIGNRSFINRLNFRENFHKMEEIHIRHFETPTNLKLIKSLPLDSIQDLINNNNLTNVNVYTIENGVIEIFKEQYPLMNFYWKDIFIIDELKVIFDFDHHTSKNKLKYKFLNLNMRYDLHRCLIASYLSKLNSKISWYFSLDFEKFKKSLWFDINNWNLKYLNRIKDGLLDISTNDYQLDYKANKVNLSGNFSDIFQMAETSLYSVEHKRYVREDIFSDIFCYIISESSFIEPTSCVSEKTFLSIRNYTPFIIVGQPHVLKYLRNIGFKTFSNFWDESYDDETNHEKRMLKIFETIDYVDKFNLDELESIYTNMLPILEHNYNHLIQLVEHSDWPNVNN